MQGLLMGSDQLLIHWYIEPATDNGYHEWLQLSQQ
jgi:hypothetical protein